MGECNVQLIQFLFTFTSLFTLNVNWKTNTKYKSDSRLICSIFIKFKHFWIGFRTREKKKKSKKKKIQTNDVCNKENEVTIQCTCYALIFYKLSTEIAFEAMKSENEFCIHKNGFCIEAYGSLLCFYGTLAATSFFFKRIYSFRFRFISFHLSSPYMCYLT